MNDIIELLKCSDPEPPVARNTPLSPRGRAELRSLVGLAAEQGAEERFDRKPVVKPATRRWPQLVSVGLTVGVVAAAGVGLTVFGPDLWNRNVTDPLASPAATAASSSPATVETASPTVLPTGTEAAPSEDATEPAETENPNAEATPAATGNAGVNPTGQAGNNPAGNAGNNPAGNTGNNPPPANPVEQGAPPAVQPPVGQQRPCGDGVSCGMDKLYDSTWRVTYAAGTIMTGSDYIKLGPDSTGLNRVSFVVGGCPLEGSTNANMFVAQDNGTWDFGPDGGQPQWRCDTPPNVSRDAYIQVLWDLGQASSWYMPTANTVEFWSTPWYATDRSQTQNRLVVFQK